MEVLLAVRFSILLFWPEQPLLLPLPHLPRPVPLAMRMSWPYLLAPPLGPRGSHAASGPPGPPCLPASHWLAGWVSLDSPSLARVNFQRKSSLPRQFYFLINSAPCGNSPLPRRCLPCPPTWGGLSHLCRLTFPHHPSSSSYFFLTLQAPGNVTDGFTQERNSGAALSGGGVNAKEGAPEMSAFSLLPCGDLLCPRKLLTCSLFGYLQGSQLYSGESWVLKCTPSCSSCLY